MANLFSGKLWLAGIAAVAVVATTALPADAQFRRQRQEHRPLPSTGEPGQIVAADIAFAKALREEGLSAALGEHAVSSAVVHTALGRLRTSDVDPVDYPRELGPNSVWTSCDGTVAVSFGRYRNADGVVGSYASVWELQSDRDYKWTYRLQAADDPQPAKPPLDSEIADPENTIVVAGLDIIEGKVADCARFADIPDLRVAMTGDSISEAGEASSDGTLYWRWSSSVDGSRRIRVFILREGLWETALDFGTGRWSDVR